MKYFVDTPKRGWYLKPDHVWDGKDKSFKFRIFGESDSDYAKCPVTRHNVSDFATFFEGASVTVKLMMQNIVEISVTEAKIIEALCFAKYMINVMRILNALGLLVESSMKSIVDNSQYVDIANNWSNAGLTRNMDEIIYLLRYLKEEGIINTV